MSGPARTKVFFASCLLVFATSCASRKPNAASPNTYPGVVTDGGSYIGRDVDANLNDATDTSIDPDVDAGKAQPKLSGHAVVYSAGQGIGVGSQRSCDVVLDARGRLTIFDAGDTKHLDVGTCRFRSAGRSETANWGTWIDGEATGRIGADTSLIFDARDDVFHYATGKLTAKAQLPSGKITYFWNGASAPTETGVVKPGTLEDAHLEMSFGASTTVQIELDLYIDEKQTLITEVGTRNASDDGFIIVDAQNDATTTIHGYVVGDEAQSVIIAYAHEIKGEAVMRGSAVLDRK